MRGGGNISDREPVEVRHLLAEADSGELRGRNGLRQGTEDVRFPGLPVADGRRVGQVRLVRLLRRVRRVLSRIRKIFRTEPEPVFPVRPRFREKFRPGLFLRMRDL